MQEADAQDVRQPHSSAVHHSSVGVHLAVRRAHVHDGGGGGGGATSKALKVQTVNDPTLNCADVIICLL